MSPHILVESREAVLELEAFVKLLRNGGGGGEAVTQEEYRKQGAQRADL